MLSTLREGVGHVLLIRDRDGSVVSGQFFLKDAETFHAVAHGANMDGLSFGASAFCYRSLVNLAMESGVRYIDLNGANSPNRADYKHSWFAEPKLFFNITRNDEK